LRIGLHQGGRDNRRHDRLSLRKRHGAGQQQQAAGGERMSGGSESG
jgi:hypothetical protein